MKRHEFLEFLVRFSKQPIPATMNRHVYLWTGEVEDLITSSPAGFFKKLDLHMLCGGLSKFPLGDKAAGRVLSEAIEKWISENITEDQKQQGLVVTGLDLFYRYHLPLSSIVCLATENTLIVLALPSLDTNFRPSQPFPSYVDFAPQAILKYVTSGITEDAIVKEE